MTNMVDPDDPANSESQHRNNLTPSQSGRIGEKQWMRFAGMGLELASYTLGLCAIGYAADWYFGLDPQVATAAGTLIGFAFGMYRFIQQANAANKNEKSTPGN